MGSKWDTDALQRVLQAMLDHSQKTSIYCSSTNIEQSTPKNTQLSYFGTNAFWKAIQREEQRQPIPLTCFWLPSPQRVAPRSGFAILPFAFRFDSVQELKGFLQVLAGCRKLIQCEHHLSQVSKKGVSTGVWLHQVNIPGHVHTTQGSPHFHETSSHKKLVFNH